MPPNDPQWGRKEPEGPPDLEEILRRVQRRLRLWFPAVFANRRLAGGPGSGPSLARVGTIIAALIALLWLASGVYIVDAGHVGMILRFGRLVEITQPGPHMHLPWPIEAQAEDSPLNIAQVQSVEIGYRGSVSSKNPQESLMLTDDENIVDVQFAVQYTIKDPEAFLFNNRDPNEAVRQAAESAIREVIGRNRMDSVLNEGRTEIAATAGLLMQKLLDRYGAGIAIGKVNMQNAQPPEQVQAAFDDAVKAGQDSDRKTNEGQAYANDVVPRAKGDAARLIAQANAYRQSVVAQAEGDASRFKQIYAEYQKSPNVTRQRLYIDMMQQVLSATTKVLAEQKGQGSLLYLPLDKLMRNADGVAGVAPATPPSVQPTPLSDNSARPAGNPPANGDPQAAGNDLGRNRDNAGSREREQRP
jgi:membrane protease subunit HflK